MCYLLTYFPIWRNGVYIERDTVDARTNDHNDDCNICPLCGTPDCSLQRKPNCQKPIHCHTHHKNHPRETKAL